jgi:hypothetical protein
MQGSVGQGGRVGRLGDICGALETIEGLHGQVPYAPTVMQ